MAMGHYSHLQLDFADHIVNDYSVVCRSDAAAMAAACKITHIGMSEWPPFSVLRLGDGSENPQLFPRSQRYGRALAILARPRREDRCAPMSQLPGWRLV